MIKIVPVVMVNIVDKMLGDVHALLADKGVKMIVTAEVLEHLAVEGYDPAFGARPLARLIRQAVTEPLSTTRTVIGLTVFRLWCGLRRSTREPGD